MTYSLRKLITYLVIPFCFTLLCQIIYFFDLFNLSFIISPEINREYGLVENIQLVTILLIFYLAWKAFRRNLPKYPKLTFLFIMILSVFIFLEEIDYGLHYLESISNETYQKLVNHDSKPVRNLHNQGKLNTGIKFTVYGGFIITLVILPFFKKKIRSGFLNWLIPSRDIILTLIGLFLTGQIALYFKKTSGFENLSLRTNVSEFEEVFIYYIAFLFVAQLFVKSHPDENIVLKKWV